MKEIYDQLPMFPCYRVRGTKEVFLTLQEAARAIGNVTIDREHRLIRRYDEEKDGLYRERSNELQAGTYSRTTLFREIEAISKQPNPGIRELYDKSFGKKEIEGGYMAEICLKALSAAIEAAWDPGRVHIMPHSSGYDSRVISGLLMRLAQKNGVEWLGEMRFLCWEPEIGYFRRIMAHEGWPEHFILPVRPTSWPQDYYRDVLDFDRLGRVYSEAERLWLGPVLAGVVLEEEGFSEEGVQGITALFADETGKANRLGYPDIGYFLGAYLMDLPFMWPGQKIPFIAPFVSREWLECLTRYKIPARLDHFKLAMIHILDDQLANIHLLPNFRFVVGPILRDKGYHSYQMISDETMQKMKESFLGSWYCKTFKREGIMPFESVVRPSDDKMKEYVRAAICEGLIRGGLNIHSMLKKRRGEELWKKEE